MSEKYQQILKELMTKLPEVEVILVIDKNTNVIAYRASNQSVVKDLEKKIEPIAISTGVTYLSILKIQEHLELNNINQLYVKNSDGYLLVLKIDLNRLLLVKMALHTILVAVFLDFKNAIEKINKIPYIMPAGKISLERKLEEIEDEFQENYKIFFSYAKSDSSKFKIKEIAEYLETSFPNVEAMYFEKSNIAGEDILDYMERGVNWCNFFIWFHSPESMKSEAVKKEYKMAVYLGKKIISITTDFNELPLSARVTWSLLFKGNSNEICNQLMDDITNYDMKTATKQEW